MQIILTHTAGPPLQGHPMIPVLHVARRKSCDQDYQDVLDRVLDPGLGSHQIAGQILDLLPATASLREQPKLWAMHNTDFQVTRGLLGVSL